MFMSKCEIGISTKQKSQKELRDKYEYMNDKYQQMKNSYSGFRNVHKMIMMMQYLTKAVIWQMITVICAMN